MKQSRALQEVKALSSSREYELNRHILIRPISIILSLISLPFLAQFLKASNLFSGLHNILSEPLRELFWEEELNNYVATHPEYAGKLLKGSIFNPEIFINFENDVKTTMLEWPDHAAVVLLQRAGFRQVNSGNYVEIVHTIPYQLRELPLRGRNHTVFYVAQLADWLYEWRKDKRLMVKYGDFLVFLMPSLQPYQNLPLDKFLQFREPRERGIYIDLTNCTRYAELIQSALPYYFSKQAQMKKIDAPIVLSRLGNRLFWLGVGVAILGNYFFVKPLLMKIINNSRLRFLRDDHYFGKPLKIKNYRVLSAEALVSENHKFKKALDMQRRNVKNSKILEYFLLLLCLGYCLWNLLEGGGFVNGIFLTAPIFFCMLSQNVKEKIENHQLVQRLNVLEAQVKIILKPCQQEYAIEKINRGKLAYSYITIQIYKTLPKKLHAFPEKLLVTMINSVLNHFNIVISAYDETNISLAAETSLDVPLIADFFKEALAAAITHYQIGCQLKPIISKMEPHVSLEAEFINLLKPVWKIDNAEIKALCQGDLSDIIQERDCIKITRNTPFSDNQLKILEKKIIILSLPQPDTKAQPPDLSTFKKSKKGKPFHVDQKNSEILPAKKPNVLPRASIFWPLANVKSDDPSVKPVENRSYRFMLFDLPKEAFGNNGSQTREIFCQKSTQMAKKKDSQGIKHGQYLGTNISSNRQQIFPARIKVLGQHGDDGVLLSVETATTGELLYQTQAFERNIH